MTPAQIEKLRASIYHCTRATRVRTMTDAARFIDAVGLAFLFGSERAGLELPSLFEAIKGRRGAHIWDWDADADRVWGWKSDLAATQRAYYGKALAGKPVFVARRLLPALYATTAEENFERAYRLGRVSRDAQKIYDALNALGPTPTMALRVAAGLEGKDGNVRYHRALDELQRKLVILPVGATKERGAWTSQIFELVARWFPKEVERGQRLALAAARRALVTQYVRTVVAATPAMIARLFGWPRAVTQDTIADLLARKTLTEQGGWLVVRNSEF